jgi:hypothetical protein
MLSVEVQQVNEGRGVGECLRGSLVINPVAVEELTL